MVNAKEAQAISEPIIARRKTEAKRSFIDHTDRLIREAAAKGESALWVGATQMKNNDGEAHYKSMGFAVTLIDSDRYEDKYRIDWSIDHSAQRR